MKVTDARKCDCFIGEWIDYDDTSIVTESELFRAVEYNNSLYKKNYRVKLADYCDFRKSVNLIRFKYCPMCGQQIDWKAIKRRATDGSKD